jgi:hypothetical protein
MAKLEWTNLDVIDPSEGDLAAPSPTIRMGMALIYEHSDPEAADVVQITVSLPYDTGLSIEDLRVIALTKAKAVLAKAVTDLPEATN